MTISTTQDDGTGASNAAVMDLGSDRTLVDIHADTTGDAMLTVEVSKNGDFSGEERTFDTVSYKGASQEIEQYETAYRYLRAYLDQNRNLVEMSVKEA